MAGESASEALALPLEVVDLITEHLEDDSLSLRSCALLSLTWLVSARRRLFSTTCFHVDTGDDEDEEQPYCEKLSEFLAFLQSTDYVCGFIKELQLFCYNPMVGEATNHQVDLTLLFRVAHKLTSLKTLVLDSVFWSGLPPKSIRAKLICPSIETLVVKDISSDTDDLEQITAIFHLLPNLSCFEAKEWQMEILDVDMDDSEELVLPSRMKLGSLTVFSAPGALLSAVSSTATASTRSLRTLRIYIPYGSYSDVERTGLLLKSVGPNLRYLDIGLSLSPVQDRAQDPEFIRTVWSDLNLSSCVALRTLVLSVTHPHDTGALSPWLSAESMLSTVPGARLRTLEFELSSFERSSVAEANWIAIETILKRFKQLRVIRFQATKHPGPSAWRYITKRLPSFHAKGMLHMEHS